MGLRKPYAIFGSHFIVLMLADPRVDSGNEEEVETSNFFFRPFRLFPRPDYLPLASGSPRTHFLGNFSLYNSTIISW